MKKIVIAMSLFFTLTALADIEAMPGDETKASASEIASSRACFSEVERAGCKNPGEDQAEFRSCMSSNYSSLSAECQKMLGDLYGSKK